MDRENAKKFVLIMRDRRNVTRPRRAKLYPDGSIVWKKKLYYYSNNPNVLTYYPTKPNLYGLTLGLLPAHIVREENSIPIKYIPVAKSDKEYKELGFRKLRPIIDKEEWVNKYPVANGAPDIIPETPFDFEGSDIAHKFKESNVVGGLAQAARKSQQADMMQKYMVFGIAGIFISVIIGLAVIINGMGILKLW